MKRIINFGILIFLIGVQVSFAQQPSSTVHSTNVTGTITVAAAANLATVGDPLKAAFTALFPQAKVDFVFGASGALTTQIQNGAPFHLFLSADMDFPKKLDEGGFTLSHPRIYAIGKLILLSVKPLDFKQGLTVLAEKTISQFAMANPEIAPYGKAAQEALEKAGLWEKVKIKAVTAQSISQALQFTTGATGVGFVNKSALFTKEMAAYRDKQGSLWYDVDPTWYSPINQAYVLLKFGAANPTAQAFGAFLSTPQAKEVFIKAGYAVP